MMMLNLAQFANCDYIYSDKHVVNNHNDKDNCNDDGKIFFSFPFQYLPNCES